MDAYLAALEGADTVAATDGSSLDHRTNPRVLADRLRSQDALHRELTRLEHERHRLAAQREHAAELAAAQESERWRRSAADRDARAIAEGQADAEEAAADLAAVRAWEREESPVTAARSLARERVRRSREFLAFSAIASIVSAVGIAAVFHVSAPWPLPWWGAGALGAAVEAVLTVLVTRIIAAQSSLDALTKSPRGTGERDRVEGYPWVVVTLLLVTSIALNLYGVIVGTGVLGTVGAVGAVVAALCAGMAWTHSRAVAAAISANMSLWRGRDWAEQRAELRRRAAGAYIPHPPEADHPSGPSAGALAGVVLAPEDEQFLTHLDEQFHAAEWGGGGVAAPERGVDPETRGVDAEASSQNHPSSTPGVHPPSPTPTPPALVSAQQQRARRARERLAAAVAELRAEGVEVTQTAVRPPTGMDLRTIKRHWHVVTEPEPE